MEKIKNEEQLLTEFRILIKAAKDLSDRYAGKMYRMYLGENEEAKKEHLLLDFEIWGVYQNHEDVELGHLVSKVENENEVLIIKNKINDFNIRVLFDKNGQKERISRNQFMGVNKLF